MCFSAEASFGASAVLGVIGVEALRQKRGPEQLLLAGIPLLFSFQQFSEGFVWLSLINPSFAFLEGTATYTFVFFALLVWPVWVPLSVYLAEQDEQRKKMLLALVLFGASLTGYLIYRMSLAPVTARIDDHHIRYDMAFYDVLEGLSSVAYFIPTIIPALISTTRRVGLLSFALFSSYLLARIFYHYHIISVWCFFAAIISFVVVFIVRTEAGDRELKAVRPGN